jgi:hypothetical protein
MSPFPESAASALWLGFALALIIGLLVAVRLAATLRRKR